MSTRIASGNHHHHNHNNHHTHHHHHHSGETVLDEKLPIFVNGYEKYATGLTKRTTVDDVKFAMLTVSDPCFKPDQLDEFIMLERWQGNERVLDGRIKIYKLIRLWQSLPGDQLSQVKFMIKKQRKQATIVVQPTQMPINCNSSNFIYHDEDLPIKYNQHKINQQQQHNNKLTSRDINKMPLLQKSSPAASAAAVVKKVVSNNNDNDPISSSSKKFAFCTLSPALQKTWAIEKAKRKSSYVKRQLRMTSQTRLSEQQQQQQQQQQQISTSSLSSSASSSSPSPASSDVDEDLNNNNNNNVEQQQRRYASIKRFNRARKSTIKRTEQMKKSFIDLVNKQNEIIDKQLNKLADMEELKTVAAAAPINKIRSKSLDKYERAKSKMAATATIKSSASAQSSNELNKQLQEIVTDFSEKDIAMAFGKQESAKEYTKLCNDYFRLQHCLSSKLNKINDLNAELKQLSNNNTTENSSEIKLFNSIQKTSKKLQSSIDTSKVQAEKINDLSSALTNIDDIISLKTKFIESLEQELERLENMETVAAAVPSASKPVAAAVVQKPPSLTSYSSASSTSSTSSTSSVLTSISSVSTSTRANVTTPANKSSYASSALSVFGSGAVVNCGSSGNDNESDTGISSANSDDFNTQLETLV